MCTVSLVEACYLRASVLNQHEQGNTETRDPPWGLSLDQLASLAEIAADILEHRALLQQEAEIDGVLQEVHAVKTLLDSAYLGHNEAWEKWRIIFIRMAIAKGLDYDHVEDFTQETCLRAQSALTSFRFDSTLKTYLLAVFSNCLLDYKRRLRRRATHEVPDDPVPPNKSGDDPPEDSIEATASTLSPEEAAVDQENAEIMELLYAEVQRILTSSHFEIFRLYYIDMTYIDPRTGKLRKWTAEAIADRLDKPKDTVSSILKRMPKKLRNNPRIMQLLRDYLASDIQSDNETEL